MESHPYTDKNGDSATIPAGFAVSQVEGENIIDDGLVVIDSNGNEFVWVPVKDINEMAQCSTAGGDCNLILQNDQLICQTHNNTQIVGKLYVSSSGDNFDANTPNTIFIEGDGNREPDTTFYYDNNSDYLDIIKSILTTRTDDYTDTNSLKETMKKDYKVMAKSVTQYQGFYIGRYEISKSNNNNAQSTKNSIALTATEDSANTWYGLYAYGKTYKNSENSVVSSMVWGSQYDALMKWLQKRKKRNRRYYDK